jgi:hypothetical protein
VQAALDEVLGDYSVLELIQQQNILRTSPLILQRESSFILAPHLCRAAADTLHTYVFPLEERL